MGKKMDIVRELIKSQLNLILHRLEECNYPGRWVNDPDIVYWLGRSSAYVIMAKTISSAEWVKKMEIQISKAAAAARWRREEHRREMRRYEELAAQKSVESTTGEES